jgi:hypothetical protein
VIWHHGRFYLYEGWAIAGPRGNDGPRKMQRTGRYPGYIRLRELGTDKILTIRSDCVMLNAVVV